MEKGALRKGLENFAGALLIAGATALEGCSVTINPTARPLPSPVLSEPPIVETVMYYEVFTFRSGYREPPHIYGPHRKYESPGKNHLQQGSRHHGPHK
jgi:hypothetical protein